MAEFRNECRRIAEGGKTSFRKRLDQAQETRNSGADWLYGQEHIRDPGGCSHFGFGDSGRLTPGDTKGELESEDLGELVSFKVRAQTGGIAGDGHHPAQVFLNPFEMQYERRRRHVGLVFKCHPVGGIHKLSGSSNPPSG